MGKPSVLVSPEVKGKDVLVQARVACHEKKRLREFAQAKGLNEREILIRSIGNLMANSRPESKELVKSYCLTLDEGISETDELVQFWVCLPFKRRMRRFAALNDLKLREVVLLALILYATEI